MPRDSILREVLDAASASSTGVDGKGKDQPPVFFLPQQSVQVLSTPTDFYEELLHGIKSSRRRISIAALYIGTGKMEKNLLDNLRNTMNDQPQVKVSLLFDYNRAYRQQRRSNSAAFTSSVESITSELFSRRNCPHQMLEQLRISLLRVPLAKPASLADSMLEQLPPKIQEMMGVMHMKFFVFDDTVIISGANLSTDYFTTRQVKPWRVSMSMLSCASTVR